MSDELAAIGRILDAGGDADDVLRQVVAVLRDRFAWVGIAFVEDETLVLGPSTGAAPSHTTDVPITYEGKVVAELRVGSGDDRAGKIPARTLQQGGGVEDVGRAASVFL